MPQRMHGLDDGKLFAVVVHAAHEIPIDLEIGHRQALQIAERRLSLAEVVQRELDAARLQCEDQYLARIETVDGSGFGHLETDPRRVEVVLADIVEYEFGRTRIAEAATWQVDRITGLVFGMRVEVGDDIA